MYEKSLFNFYFGMSKTFNSKIKERSTKTIDLWIYVNYNIPVKSLGKHDYIYVSLNISLFQGLCLNVVLQIMHAFLYQTVLFV